MKLTLEQFNHLPAADALAAMAGLYEHSPWIAEAALAARPFLTLAQLRQALRRVVDEAPQTEQRALLCAHPELAGKAMVAGTLTDESRGEQSRAGLTQCSAAELAHLAELNAAYRARFGFPFILAVRGARGNGLSKQEIIACFERRLGNPLDFEWHEALRNVHRIAEIRLDEKFGVAPTRGDRVLDAAFALAEDSESAGGLTVHYLSPAHRACSARLLGWMRDAGFDEAGIDAVGNVVGRYHGTSPAAPLLMTGSHYDTVRDAGRLDGRLGILLAIEAVRGLVAEHRRLPFGIELVAFAEEEGQRFPTTFLGASALVGDFDPAWLALKDATGVTLADAMRGAGLPATMDAIGALARDPARYLGYVEVHIEQGPVLNRLGLPLGVVTSINGNLRFLCEFTGQASHAGTTPMGERRDAAAAAAELALYVERRAAADGTSVGTVGLLNVPDGSINVVPGRCRFSLDLRAPADAQRDALWNDVRAEGDAICLRRGVQWTYERVALASAAPSAHGWQVRWEQAVASLGLPVHRMPSGAGHDAMKIHQRLPQAMLFVRGENAGISHNPLESSTNHDIELAVQAFDALLTDLAREMGA